MNNQQQVSKNQIQVKSLSREISEKSVVIANLQANLYELANENAKLKKKLKPKSNSKAK